MGAKKSCNALPVFLAIRFIELRDVQPGFGPALERYVGPNDFILAERWQVMAFWPAANRPRVAKYHPNATAVAILLDD